MSKMLSRVAENLYWMSRYMERAEHAARLVDVTLDLIPDRSIEANQHAWRRTFEGLHLSSQDTDLADAYTLTQNLTFGDTNSITQYIASARDNARQVREHISSEMWEQINRLYLDSREATMQEIWSDRPHAFFHMIKQATHLFQGITDSTMYHGEGWTFIQVGMSIERAGNVAALLGAYMDDATPVQQEAMTSTQYVDWVSLLRSCTALEAYWKVYTAELRMDTIAEFLLLNAKFPHSVHFAVNRMQRALRDVSESTGTPTDARVNRQIGRLKSTLDYDQIDEVLASDLRTYLENIQTQCSQIHDIVYHTYVNYPADQRLDA